MARKTTADLNHEIKEIKMALDGNGYPGIKTKVALLDNRLKRIEWMNYLALGGIILTLIREWVR